MNQLVKDNKNNNSSKSLVFGRWPQTKMRVIILLGFAFHFLLPINGDASSTQVIEFGVENRAENYFEVLPGGVAPKSLDFSICLRCKFWSWGEKVVFTSKSETIYFYLGGIEENVGVFFMSKSIHFPTHAFKVSPTLWNSVCFVHNATDASVTIALNDFHSTFQINDTGLTIENLKEPIFIGTGPNM